MHVRSDSGKCLPSWVERNANVFQILIGEMGEYGNILVLGKAQSVSAELLKSVRNLPHRGPGVFGAWDLIVDLHRAPRQGSKGLFGRLLSAAL